MTPTSNIGAASPDPTGKAGAPNLPNTFDPARIADMLEAVEPSLLHPIIRKAADSFYDQMLGSVEDYLRDNLDWNLTSHLTMLERENQRMRTELFEVDRALGCMSLGHKTRLDAIAETNDRYKQASAESWRLRDELAQAIAVQS